MTLPAVLRGGLLLLLVGAAFLLPVREPDARAPGVVQLAADWQRGASAKLFTGPRPRAVVRSSASPPNADELAALAALDAPVLAALPERSTNLELFPPPRPVAGRAAALAYRARGEPGDSAWFVASDEAGPIDSTLVRFAADGTASGAVRVRPAREGWRRWSAALGGSTTRTAAWAASARPLRVRVLAGPPSWESKFVVRALEESGAEVELREPLGRGLDVRSPAGVEGAEDVVLVLDGAAPGAATRDELSSWVAEQAGGVLLAGAAAGLAPLSPTRRIGAAGEVAAGELRWRLPPELSPLPRADVRSAFTALREPRTGVRIAATAPTGGALALRGAGRGRIAALGVTESWRWRMQAGQVAEHRAFWRSLAEWLAGGAREPVVMVLSSVEAAPGETVPVTVFARFDAPANLTLRDSAGRARSLPLAEDKRTAGVLRTRWIPAGAGLYTLSVPGSAPAAAVEVRSAAAVSLPWARLALLADQSGGAAVEAADLAAEVARREAVAGEGAWDPRPWLFAAVLLLAAAEWGIRRVRGRA